MTLMKVMIIIALTMALFITIATTSFNVNGGEEENTKTTFAHAKVENELVLPSKRVSRFLAEDLKNPRAADHCNKDHQVCSFVGGHNTTCCNNKCIDLAYDNKNCGACKNKCKYTETCCRGECVNVAYDKRHCGKCNNRCHLGEYCVYSMCNYA